MIHLPVFCIPVGMHLVVPFSLVNQSYSRINFSLGHGVGVAASILSHCSPLTAAYSIAKGFRRRFDLMEVCHDNKLLCYSCLLIGWGLVADIEFDTSKYRWIGPIRYTLGALSNVTNPTYYKLRVSYLPAKEQTMKFCTGEGCTVCNSPVKSDDENSNGWVVEEGLFMQVAAFNLSDSTKGHRIAPYAHASDGCMDLVIMKDISRKEYIELYNSIGTGSYVDGNFFMDDKLGYVKVKAFRVESLDGPCNVGIDGIRYVQEQTIEVSILPSVATLGA